MSRFLGITREPVFSPGKIGADAAVLEAVAAQLRALGHVVSVCSGDALHGQEAEGVSAVFTMCQGSAALERLERWQAGGLRVVNSPQAILNCQRHRTVVLLARAGVPFPRTILVDTAGPRALPSWVSSGAWVKRGDFHATEAADVVRVAGIGAARAALHAFERRGIRTAVVQQHMPGTVLKFYGVRGSFFHCVPPPGAMPITAAVREDVQALGEGAAAALGVEIYGGDCVYDGAAGTLSLIDLNDWPSYASCRAEAATYIAAYLDARDIASER